MPQLFDRIVQYVDRVKILTGLYRPTLGFVQLNERDEDLEANYVSMAELARMHHIRVVFSSLLPIYNYTEDSKESFALRPRGRILTLNRWLRDYSAARGLIYLDYFSALVDDKGMMRRALSDDGLHPNAAGYKIMAPLAEKAIAQALASQQ